jgi:hypothetical protein
MVPTTVMMMTTDQAAMDSMAVRRLTRHQN